MRVAVALAAAVLLLAGCHPHKPKPKPGPSMAVTTMAQTIQLKAADGVRVFASYTEAYQPRALILLFHQAGSGKGEYASIAPRLAQAGYSTLAIDQRSGGSMFGPNQTVEALGRSHSYSEAKRDLEAALAWAKARGLPMILWGSSYSAALAFEVAAEHPRGVAALLAFSPGEYLDDKQAVHHAAAQLRVPVFVTSAKDPKEIDTGRSILAAVPTGVKEQYVPVQGGVHGSSTLIADRNKAGAEAAWQAVMSFLRRAIAGNR